MFQRVPRTAARGRARRGIDGLGHGRASATSTARAGAVVVNIGHGRAEVAAAMARQAAAAAYVHGTQFTSAVLEEYARRLAAHAPGDCRRLYLVSGGSEANETAVKMARAYHLARGRAGAAQGRSAARSPTTATRSAPSRSPAAPACRRPTRRSCRGPARGHGAVLLSLPAGPRPGPSAAWPAWTTWRRSSGAEGAETVAAYIAEPIIGASAGAAVPARGLRAARARDLRPPRRRLHRRRGHDGLRPHRPLVRASNGAASSPTS